MLTNLKAAHMSSIKDLIAYVESEKEEVVLYAEEGHIRQQYAKGLLEAYEDVLTGLYAIQENKDFMKKSGSRVEVY